MPHGMGPKMPPQRKSKLIGYFLPNEWGREAKKKLIETFRIGAYQMVGISNDFENTA